MGQKTVVSGHKHKITSHDRPIILHIDTLQRGGAEEHLLSLGLGLIKRGWLCEISIPKADLAPMKKTNGLSDLIGELMAAGIPVHLRDFLDDAVPLSSPRGLKQLVKSLSYFVARRPPLVHFVLPEANFSRLPILAAAILRIPFVLGFRLAEVKIIPPFNQRLYKWLANRPSAWLALSRQNMGILADIFCLPPERFQIVPNGIDCARFYVNDDKREAVRRKLKAEFGLEGNVRLVIGVGRVQARKGFGYLAAAIPRVLNAHFDTVFWWVGEAPEIEGDVPDNAIKFQGLLEMLKGVEEIWLRKSCFQLLGRREDISRVLAAADIFVLPSLAEGQPRALLEAMASGLPCIAARGAGLSEIITHDKDGLLVPPRDSEALAKAINVILTDKSLANRLGRAAAVRAKKFDLPKMLDQKEFVYQNLLGQRQGGVK
jgi:glycosyltransferase involved in cell wall biosynthesis